MNWDWDWFTLNEEAGTPEISLEDVDFCKAEGCMLYAGGSETKYLNSLQNEGVDVYIRNVKEVFLHNAESTVDNANAINPIKRTNRSGYSPSTDPNDYMYTCL